MTEHRTDAANESAIERATTLAWRSWVNYLESREASKRSHAEIAKLALAHMPAGVQNREWWAQNVAIAYERHAGLRVPGQAHDGTFHVSVSRTLTGDRDAVIDEWERRVAAVSDHLGFARENERRSRTDKRTFWRANLVAGGAGGAGAVGAVGVPDAGATEAGAGKVEVWAEQKGERVSAGVRHHELPSGERLEDWRVHWRELLAKL